MNNAENKKKPTAKKASPAHKGRKPVGRSAQKNGEPRTTEFFIGSRDILAGPEIASPNEHGSGGSKKKSVSPRRKSGDAGRTSPAAEAVAAPKTAAVESGRKGRKKGPAAVEAVSSKADKATREPAPKKPSAKGKSGRPSTPGKVVKLEDSIVRPAGVEAEAPKAAKSKGSAYPALKAVPDAKIRVIPLGGLNEVGKNMTLVEYGDDIVIIDCGIGFPDEDEMPGIDLVIPDVTYLENNRDRIRGMVLTHGHEDHIGAIPYILQKLDVPIYGTRLALGIVENKLREHTLPWKADLRCVKAGDTVRLGASFSVEFIHVNHSIADACALAIRTPLGLIVHTGDFKLDLTPIEGEMMDITRLGELGRGGVLLLMCESTNAERPGHTPSEKVVGKSLEYIFTVNKDKRIIISTFSSNVHRVQQIIDISARHGRKVAVTGRSMINIVSAAVELGYMKVPSGVLIDIGDIKRYRPEELTLVTTGSQGEPMSALYRMAFGEHAQVSLGLGDLVVLSASAIPGNEKLVGRIINELSKMGVQVINDAAADVHVSGHACQEELKLMQGLLKPRYFMPVHGEYKHMTANKALAESMGVPSHNIFISDIGKILEIDKKGARFAGSVPAGVILIDGYGVGDVGNIVLRDRKHLSQDGLIVVVATVDEHSGLLLSGPDIVSRGFVYVRESEELMEEVRRIAADTINKYLTANRRGNREGCDWHEIKTHVKDDITRFLYSRIKRKPMILPIIMDV